MSDYNFKAYTPSGDVAVSTLYHSYRIGYTGTASFYRESYQWDNFTTGYRAIAVIPAPATTLPLAQPILLLPYSLSQGLDIGGFTLVLNPDGTVNSWRVTGSSYSGSFTYAIAIPEGGDLVGGYGLQLLNENSNVIFDSRRKKNLQLIDAISLSGSLVEGNLTVSEPYDYYSPPMVFHYMYVGPYQVSGGIYSYYGGSLCFRPTSPTNIYYAAYVTFRGILAYNVGSFSPCKSLVMTFKVTN